MKGETRTKAESLVRNLPANTFNSLLDFGGLSSGATSITGYLLKSLIVFASYFVFARIGLSLDAFSGFASVVWPPTGIALAAVFLLGTRYWPSIALAAFSVNFIAGAPLFAAIGMSIGNTLEALVGAYVLKRYFDFQPSLERVKDVVALVLGAAFASTLISAIFGTLSLYLSGIITLDAYLPTWTAWWVGDILGNLIVAPFIFVWSVHYRRVLPWWRYARAVGLGLLLFIASLLLFKASFWMGAEPFTLTYLIFPFFIWLALRFGQQGTVTAMLGVSFVAILVTVIEFDQLPNNRLGQTLMLMQIFMGITAMTFMTLAAVVAERERNREHRQRLALRAEFLHKQRSKLLALNKAKDEFIGLASHQLRTPATGVKQYVAMLLDNYAGKLTDEQHEMLQKAYDCNEHQIQIINELLAIAQIDTGSLALQKERFDLKELTLEVLAEISETLTAKRQIIAFEDDKKSLQITADRARIRMVLENIIDNASKYSHEGKSISILISKNKGTVHLAVKDNGVGLAKKDMRKLFKKFSRIDNPLSVEVGGTGLGLYLAKKIVKLHGGNITVVSEAGNGSEFTVILPTRKKRAV